MSFLQKLFCASPLLAWFGVINLIMFAVGLVLCCTVSQQLNGIVVWVKPVKFYLSVWIYVWTMGWLLYYFRGTTFATVCAWGITASMTYEILCISVQAARGVLSHYNTTSAFNTFVSMTMGIAIVINTLIAVAVAYRFCVSPVALAPAELWSIRLGLIIFIIGSIEGGAMIRLGQHSVGADDAAEGISFLNWNKHGGDLRVAHFVALHALQVIVLVGFAAQRYAGAAAVTIVFVSAVAYLLAVQWLYNSAMQGRSLFPASAIG